MPHDRFKTLPGIPGYENTAVTMQSIKEILEEEGAAHLLRRREPEQNENKEDGPKPGPLHQLALQTPPTVTPKPAPQPAEAQRQPRKEAFPSIQSAEETYQEEPVRPRTAGLIPRIFGRK